MRNKSVKGESNRETGSFSFDSIYLYDVLLEDHNL